MVAHVITISDVRHQHPGGRWASLTSRSIGHIGTPFQGLMLTLIFNSHRDGSWWWSSRLVSFSQVGLSLLSGG